MRLLPLVLVLGCTSQPSLIASRGAPLLDGQLHEPAWRATATTGAWKGDTVVAFTEARVLWDDAAVYLGLYMADENVGPDDVVEVRLGDQRRTVRPSDPNVDLDGTFGSPGDDDEEWTTELRFPRGDADTLELELSRTDTPKGAAARSSRWSGKVTLRR